MKGETIEQIRRVLKQRMERAACGSDGIRYRIVVEQEVR